MSAAPKPGKILIVNRDTSGSVIGSTPVNTWRAHRPIPSNFLIISPNADQFLRYYDTPTTEFSISGNLPPGISLTPVYSYSDTYERQIINSWNFSGTPTLRGVYNFSLTATGIFGTGSASYELIIELGLAIPAEANYSATVGQPFEEFLQLQDPVSSPIVNTLSVWNDENPPLGLVAPTDNFPYYKRNLGFPYFTAVGDGDEWLLFQAVENIANLTTSRQGFTLHMLTGRLEGHPRQAGTFTFPVRIRYTLADGNVPSLENSENVNITLNVAEGSLYHQPTGNLTGQAGEPFSALPTIPGTFSWSATGLPSGLSINSSTGEISGTPTQKGTITATITATGQSSSVKFVLAPAAPVIKPSQTINFIYGELPVKALRNLLEDPLENYSDWNTFSVSGLPAWAAFNSSTSGYIGSAPPERGTWLCDVSVSGATGSDSGTFTLVVGFGPPILTAGQVFSATYLMPFSGQLTVEDAANRPVNGFQVSPQSRRLPQGFSLNSSGLITGTPTEAGTFTVAISPLGEGFTNPGAYQDVDYASVVFEIAFGAPIITAGQTALGKVGFAFSKTFSLTDAANRPVTSWSATGLPAGLAINTSTGAITGTPQDSGSATITLTATGPGGTDTEEATISVLLGVPLFSYPSPNDLQTIEQVSISPIITDATNRPITSWSVDGLPTGLTINSSTGEITGSPTSAGTFSATVTATGSGGITSQPIAFIVVVGFPIFAGALRATAVYAGTTAAQAVYYGPQLLWNVPGWEPPAYPASLLLHMDGANNSTLFVDSSSSNITVSAIGNAAITTEYFKFGTGAASFDGSGDYLQISTNQNPTAFNFFGQDFTIDMWVFRKSGRGLISTRTAPVYSPWTLQIGPSGALMLLIQNSSSTYFNNGLFGSLQVPMNQWAHIAWACHQNRHYIFVNGIVDPQINGVTEPLKEQFSAPDNVYIGTDGDGAFNGYIDELRVVRGVADYTANFTPPTQPY
jgi:PKD repeat protein